MRTVDADRWLQIQELFHAAADLPASQWQEFLGAHSADAEVRAAVLDMLESDAGGATLLDRGIASLADQVLDGGSRQLPPDFNPYHFTGMLGEGGMGVVYQAERTDVGKIVAIKILRDAWVSPARRGRFVREQRLLGQLNHPAIAQLLDAGTQPDGTPWFVMEYVDGVHITTHCHRQRAPLRERLRLFRQVCEAVQYAHSRLVVHRDLKPSNILVTPTGDVKLLDFGIAKQLEGAPGFGDHTRTEFRLLTPAYASPEQIRGEAGAIDSDVYSLGVVLYELLTGLLPFDLANRPAGEAERIVLAGDARAPSLAVAKAGAGAAHDITAVQAGRSEWADLDVLCLTAMHKDRARRYRTVDAVVRDVDHFLRGEPLEARPDSFGYRAGKFVQRNWRPLLGTSLVLTTVIAMVVFFTVRLQTARDAAFAEASRARRSEQFSLSLFQSDAETGPTEDLRVLTLVDRGVQEAESLAKEPVSQANLYQTLGAIYRKLGRLADADKLTSRALEQKRRLGDIHAEVGPLLTELALLRSDQGRHDEAERIAREGLARSRAAKDPRVVDVPKAMLALATVLENAGLYQKAIPILEEVLSTLEASASDPLDVSDALTSLANNHFYLSHYDVSESLNRRALAIDTKLRGARHPRVSMDLINIGAIAYERGRYADAERLYRQGVEITESWFGKEHPQTALDLTMLARAVCVQGRYVEAQPMLDRALAIKKRVYGESHASVASTLNEFGNLALEAERYDTATTYFRQTADMYRSSFSKPNEKTGIALANLGKAQLYAKKLTEAEATLREALEIFAVAVPPDHSRTGMAHVSLGRILLRQKRPKEAVVESRAGYEILKKHLDPAAPWMGNARKDLAEEYLALGQPEEAARYRP